MGVKFDEEMAEKVRPFIELICPIIIVTMVLVSCLSIKWRWMINIMMYQECLYQIVVSLVPFDDYARTTPVQTLLLCLTIFMMWYTDKGAQIVVVCIFYLAWENLKLPMIYGEQVTV